MANNISRTVTALFILTISALSLSAQEQEQKSPEEVAIEMATKYEKDLKLAPHQAFFVDSILQHDMRAMHDEVMSMRNSGTQEYTVYKQIREKWTSQIDSSFKKVLTEEQWISYLKMNGKYKKEKGAKKQRRPRG